MGKKSKENQFEITIIADTNDADYVTQISKISESELESIKPLIKAIKNFKPYQTNSSHGAYCHNHTHNFPTGECQREDLGEKAPCEVYQGVVSEDVFEFFAEELVPPGHEYGIHTIKSIEVTPYVKKIKLL